MPTLFLDCTNDMIGLWRRTLGPEDPDIPVNIIDGQPKDVPALLHGYDICINDHTFFDAELLARCAGLRHIVFLGTGASSFIDLAAAARHGIKVHTIKGYGDITVAEHTIALAMAAARGVARMDREVRAGGWRQIEGVQLNGKTLGVIGLGGIGREVARMASALGMRVLAWNRSPIAAPAGTAGPARKRVGRGRHPVRDACPERAHAAASWTTPIVADEARRDPGQHGPGGRHRPGSAGRAAALGTSATPQSTCSRRSLRPPTIRCWGSTT